MRRSAEDRYPDSPRAAIEAVRLAEIRTDADMARPVKHNPAAHPRTAAREADPHLLKIPHARPSGIAQILSSPACVPAVAAAIFVAEIDADFSVLHEVLEERRALLGRSRATGVATALLPHQDQPPRTRSNSSHSESSSVGGVGCSWLLSVGSCRGFVISGSRGDSDSTGQAVARCANV